MHSNETMSGVVANITFHGEWPADGGTQKSARDAIESFCQRRGLTPDDGVEFHVLQSSMPGEFAIVAPSKTPAYKVLPENLGLGVGVFHLPSNCNERLNQVNTSAVFSRVANAIRPAASAADWTPALSKSSYGAGVYKTWNPETDSDQYIVAVHNCDDFEAQRAFDEARRKPSMGIGEFANSNDYLKGVLLDAHAQRGALAYHIATTGLGFTASDFEKNAIFPLASRCSMQNVDAVKKVADRHPSVLIPSFENWHSAVSPLPDSDDTANEQKYLVTHTTATVPERDGSVFLFAGPQAGASVFHFTAESGMRSGLFPVRAVPLGPDRSPGRAAEKRVVFYDSSMPFHPRLPFEYAKTDMKEVQTLGWNPRNTHEKYACKMLMVSPPDVNDFTPDELFAHARQNKLDLVPIPRKSSVLGAIVEKIPANVGMHEMFPKSDANFFYAPMSYVNDIFQ